MTSYNYTILLYYNIHFYLVCLSHLVTHTVDEKLTTC